MKLDTGFLFGTFILFGGLFSIYMLHGIITAPGETQAYEFVRSVIEINREVILIAVTSVLVSTYLQYRSEQN